MKLYLLVLLFCLVIICSAKKGEKKKEETAKTDESADTQLKSKEDDEDGKVEVLAEEKTEERKVKPVKDKGKKRKAKKVVKEEEVQEEAQEEGQEEEKVEEEEDPNAKIEVEELYIPKVCQNKTKAGDHVVVHYTGWMNDGSLFDTTVDFRKGYQPFEFTLGGGTVIKGFEKAVLGMCAGQKRKVVIPPALAYGKKGSGDVPGNTTLTYDLEMFDIRKPPPHTDMFSHMDQDGDRKLSRKEVSDYMRAQAEARYVPTYDERWRQHHEKMVDNVFEYEDADEDGHITHDEFSGPKIHGAGHDEF